ncbi:hypothetical protein nbrc107696_18060 [Gordonia spumicola]|uniref:Uncharacterized protein n=1 Tax=Gordonia spumicola TaxID=589161 RepID=A0A7I9V8D6_9ACTN|nr:hypothetical protein [Gordonia spumicola]GEE01360.1 hypothetical protein nbrc107696_18060 [Gordonia spumicola]
MSDPKDQTPADPTTPLPVDDPTAPTEPVAAEPAPVPQASAAAPKAPVVVPVQRRFLIAGSVVGALAVVGLAFGAGYMVGDRGGHDSDRHDRQMSRFEERSGQNGRFPGMGQFPGQGQYPSDDQFPGRRGRQQQDLPTDPNQTPSSTTPSAVPG